ncbi:putative serine/threonine-protein kinase nek3 [Diplonema papillatum]|nr:putative serine/threonine-protein kinase nek3 [Diplonema papillatum]
MGVCHLATGPDGSLAVLKQVNLSRMNRKERSQAHTEARLLRSVQHPNIVKYINSWTSKTDNLMIAMEYAENGDLCSKVAKSRGRLWKESRVLDWFIQIALAIRHAGKQHILHRDLKSQNILISKDHTLKLADFGISRSLGNTWDKAHTFVGTPYYLAPELVLRQPYDIQVDAWALGVVLCEMLTLSHPFTGKDMRSLSANIVNGVYAKPSTSYSLGIRQLVSSLLHRSPKKRMTVAQALDTDIVKDRIRSWLTRGAADLPPVHYVAQLVKAGGLDGAAPPECVGSFLKATASSAAPAGGPPAAAPEAVLRSLAEARLEKQRAVRSEFGDLHQPPRSVVSPPLRPAPAPKEAAPECANPDLPVATSPKVGHPSAHRAGEQRSRMQTILGAVPGHCPPAHPRELLAEKRRALAALQQQHAQAISPRPPAKKR